jgi:uncharacterized membrane protein YeaQ/YmgE (transglycosylase-associated protein family)
MLIQFLVLLVIAGVCGAMGQAIGGYSHGGCLVSIALGFIGAFMGSWIAETWAAGTDFDSSGGMNFPIHLSIYRRQRCLSRVINLMTRRRTIV